MMLIQHFHSTLFNIVEFDMLNVFDHPVEWYWFNIVVLWCEQQCWICFVTLFNIGQQSVFNNAECWFRFTKALSTVSKVTTYHLGGGAAVFLHRVGEVQCWLFVLISFIPGPDKVGRKELRQRLILFSQDRFAGVVPREYRTLVQLRVKSVNDTSNQCVS